MTEQRVIIKIIDKKNNSELGTLTISADSKEYIKNNFEKPKMKFINVPKVSDPNNKTPIQYNEKTPIGSGSRIMLLEETPYQIRFKSNIESKDEPRFINIMREQKNKTLIFDKWRLQEDKMNLEGTLNFHSYVGKSFFNIRIGEIESFSHPFEVRSKKIGYQNQYPAMISDLAKAASGLILESAAPLYQWYNLSDKKRRSYYEDFMFVEYLFKSENLPESYGYIRRNIYNRLERKIEETPTSFADTISPSDLIHLISNPENLCKNQNLSFKWPKEMRNYFPFKISHEIYEETIDTPENRLIKHFITELENLIIDIKKRSPEGYVKDRVEFFHETIRNYLSDDWLFDVGPLQFVPSNSQVLQKKEGYRSFFQFYLNFEFTFRFEWKEIGNLLEGYNRRLSEIYEYWCFFKIIRVFSNIANKSINYEQVFEKRKDRKWKLQIKKGKKSKQNFKFEFKGKNVELILWYNKKFTRGTQYPSYSLPFQPDYTILVKSENRSFFIHFDAKYRSEGEVLDFYYEIGKQPIREGTYQEKIFDLSDNQEQEEIENRDKEEEIHRKYKDGDIYKMHTYKDAILRSEGAYILYPGDKKALFRVKNDQDIPSVGAFPLTPGKNGIEEQELQDFIITILTKFL